ncbi:hypothetical protein K490DRAFT_35292 [Saccharata proteae CBS 121410]|uniref:Helicase C-terminal domain-containing protein n=1 Tax=Saccharata proteae CBS 121410 TaxID=1314787 RepID=A0A9P4HW08_9PEZI|nr:hypothetical protein K490DRAFT_35292 [Saccharata proteae CBS 121410]
MSLTAGTCATWRAATSRNRQSLSFAEDGSLRDPERTEASFPQIEDDHDSSRPCSDSSSPATSTSAAVENLPTKPQSGSYSRSRSFPDFELYLPLGCLVVQVGESAARISAREWTDIGPEFISSQGAIPAQLQGDLLKLLKARWIKTRVIRAGSTETMIIRVHVLPEDVGRGYVDRTPRAQQLALEHVLDSIDVSSEAWFGRSQGNGSKFDRWATPEHSSLFYLFNTLPSPAPSPENVSNLYSRVAMEELLEGRVQGLRTELYPFQARTSALMLQREAASKPFLDPRLETRTAPDGSQLIYCPNSTTFLKEPRQYESSQGGILAESMGYGKTVIAISLILATRCHFPQKPALGQTGIPVRTHTGSLLQMSASAAGRHNIHWKADLLRREMATGECFAECEKALQKTVYYKVASETVRRHRRSRKPPPQRYQLCSGTIIVVPRNLIHQWQSELRKHVEEGELKVLVMDESYKVLPPSAELATFDIVLFDRTRFEAELSDGSDAQGRRRASAVSRYCDCPYIGATRTRDCTCLRVEEVYNSPLKKLHWLRIMIDEGHGFSSPNSNAVLVAQKLVRAERRWVISGTPAKDELLGVEIDLASNDYTNTDKDVRSVQKEALAKRKMFDAMESQKAVHSLGNLAVHFLQTRPWANMDRKERNNWVDHMYRHEDTQRRTFSSFSLCMRQTLEQLIVKTQIDDVERDIDLPPLTHRVVYLEPSYYDKVSANNFVLVLTSNAVTSERTDIDYLFHPKSQKARNQLITNLRTSNCFWTGFTHDDIHHAVGHGQRYLEKDSNCSQEDRNLLALCMGLAQDYCLSSEHWKAMSATHEFGLFVEDWPQNSPTWSLSNSEPSLYGVTQLLQAQKLVNSRTPTDYMNGFDKAGSDAVAKVFSSLNSRPKAIPKKKQDNTTPKEAEATQTLDSKRKVTAKDEGNPTSKKTEAPQKTPRKRSRFVDSGEELPFDSPLRRTRVVGTVSAKMTYLLEQVMTYYEQEKILIFFDADNTAYYLAQCLDLLAVKHEIYAKGLSNEMRSRYIVNFDKDDTIRVLLMDVRLGALGLNINQASRVYFINPVCRPSIEAQAIKRAHRIGQTKPVHVETLILRGTIEDAMFERSKSMTRNEHMEAKTLEDDQKITEIIQQARPLHIRLDEARGDNGMARLKTPQQLFGRPGRLAAQHSPMKNSEKKKQKIDNFDADQDQQTMEFMDIPPR